MEWTKGILDENPNYLVSRCFKVLRMKSDLSWIERLAANRLAADIGRRAMNAIPECLCTVVVFHSLTFSRTAQYSISSVLILYYR